MIYPLLFRLVFARRDAEETHTSVARAFRRVTGLPGAGALLRRVLGPKDPALAVQALGLRFPSPLGVAAGMDKDAGWFESLGALGFGYVEVGTVTALPQDGNPRPRVLRFFDERALLNSMGFPNPGAKATAVRLRAARRTIVGVNVGKSMVVALEDAGADYRAAVRELAPHAAYLVINVSSPNTAGLRTMQSIDKLEPLVADVRRELSELGLAIPTLVKIGPDLSDEDVDAVGELVLRLGLDGIVAVNTTLDRSGLAVDPQRPGGVSGAPLKARSVAVLRRLRAIVGDRAVLVSVGGIETADDAWERVVSGASLLQSYTGFVYGGPLWPARINRGLLRRMRQAGFTTLEQAVGSAAQPRRP